MDDTERQKRVNLLREKAMRLAAEENERMERQAAIDRCDKCPNPKQQYDRELLLPNGIRLSLFRRCCESPNSDCTAVIQSHLMSESPAVANRIVEWLYEQPELKAIGVGYVVCLHVDVDRLILRYRVPVQAQVVARLGTIPVEEFR